MSLASHNTDVWVVIPAFNEAATLRSVVKASMDEHRNIVVINDGSNDSSDRVLKDLPVTVLHNTTQMGKAHCLWRGFQLALSRGASAVITLDADGQHAPRDITRFLRHHSLHPDAFIVGVRSRTRGIRHPLRYLANRLADWSLGFATGGKLLDSQCGYRLYPSGLLSRLHWRYTELSALRLSESFVFESEILLDAVRLGFGIEWLTLSPPLGCLHRPSHFRPIRDSYFITHRVLRRLVATGQTTTCSDSDDGSGPTCQPKRLRN